MPYCPRCGKEVTETENFCPNCGANLRPEALPPKETIARAEKAEKREKEEKGEKGEKAEKHEKEEKREKEEASPIGPIVGGVILIFVGFMFFIVTARVIPVRETWPYLLIFLGVVVIIIAVYMALTASKRSPRP